jgi:flagellar protein FliS
MYQNMSKATSAYRQASASVHPSIAIVKIYDELILAVRQATRAKEEGLHELAFSKVSRAAMILHGLINALDMDRGGAVSARLLKIYRSYILCLHLSYGKPDVIRRYNKLAEGLVALRDAWIFVAAQTMSPKDTNSPARPS